MPHSTSSIEKIRAELAWVSEPVDPNKCGCLNFDAAKRLAIVLVVALARLRQSSGPFDGNTTARGVGSTNGAT